MSRQLRRIAVLYSRLSDYIAACLKTLKEQFSVEVLVFRRQQGKEAPFDERYFEWIDALYTKDDYDGQGILSIVQQFDPQAVLMSGWMDSAYLDVARNLRKGGTLVIAGSDSQWRGTARQHFGSLVAPWFLHSAIDVMWVTGERQRQLAKRLGYRGSNCWSGFYACNWDRFAIAYHAAGPRSKRFLYVGRYVQVKGIEVLVEAYAKYRQQVKDPWELHCVGTGAYRDLLRGQKGVRDRGFVQPDDLPDLMAEAGAFVLPSHWEPWGVVVQEAAAAGLPLLCSEACGAAVHLLQDGYNGLSFETGNADHLADCMLQLASVDEAEFAAMRQRSYNLSKQFTPMLWAQKLVRDVSARQARV